MFKKRTSKDTAPAPSPKPHRLGPPPPPPPRKARREAPRQQALGQAGGKILLRPAARPQTPSRPRGLRPVKPPPDVQRPPVSRIRLPVPSSRVAAPQLGPASPKRPSFFRKVAQRVPWRAVSLAATGLACALLLVAAYTGLARQPHLSESDVKQLAAQVMASATPPPPIAAQVYAAVAPSVVQIVTDKTENGEEGHGSGSGVVLDQSGHILTALHVVDGASKIQVGFADGTVSDATVVTTQPEKDIAVLGVGSPPAQIVPATLGDPGALRVGDDAIVIGNPFGLRYTTTSGVISGLERSFKVPKTDQELTGLIQFDAAVNPGNSGGPLVNRNGEVVGIVTALANPTDQSVFIGIGFAVPIDVAASAAGSPPF